MLVNYIQIMLYYYYFSVDLEIYNFQDPLQEHVMIGIAILPDEYFHYCRFNVLQGYIVKRKCNLNIESTG